MVWRYAGDTAAFLPHFGGALFLGMGNKKPRLGGRGFKVKQPKEKLPTRRFAAGAGRLSCAPPAV
jgi:hypothetical protein